MSLWTILIYHPLTDEAFLGEFNGKPPGDFLQLSVLIRNKYNCGLKKTDTCSSVRAAVSHFTSLYQSESSWIKSVVDRLEDE